MASLKSWLYYHLLKRRLAQFRALNLPLPEARARRDAESERRFKLPPGIAAEAAGVAGRPGEWLRPEGSSGTGLMLYLHGGAYVQGSVKTHRALAARLALASGAKTFIVDYRLAPEHPFPAALDDAFTVYQSLQASHPNEPLAVAGDSAGGGLAVALALRIKAEAAAMPAALALLSPWTDLTLSNATHETLASVDPYFPTRTPLRMAAAAYCADASTHDPLVSPQFADLSSLPPTLIHVGALEALLDDSRVLAQRMQAQGTEAQLAVYPGMWHVWQIFGGKLREADQSLTELGTFLHSKLAAA
jgi:acetyl esterase/lipase